MPSDGRIIYLAYGSNLHPARLRERIGNVELLDVVRLAGWRLIFDKHGADGSAKANLRPVPGGDSVAWAAAWSIERRQLPLLDRFEGCGRGYETIRFEVPVSGAPVDALAYLAPSHWTSPDLQPFDWYRDLIVAGARCHRLPDQYIESIAATLSMRDPDTQRARSRFRLLAEGNGE